MIVQGDGLSSRLAEWLEKSAFCAADMRQTVEKPVSGLHYSKHLLQYIHITLMAKCLVDRCNHRVECGGKCPGPRR